ncbi:hypothetical protein LSTR_LSTR001126 [Laodelphax striatellus]|uniref:Uncharacterized protein n=1 Tax=Laodelphax striatellus TaxID=195883 RepID=A0A482X163_LAOST|nr:hypothetical protein LSTR_LSTR001126 [Laodelphax striatellus]
MENTNRKPILWRNGGVFASAISQIFKIKNQDKPSKMKASCIMTGGGEHEASLAVKRLELAPVVGSGRCCLDLQRRKKKEKTFEVGRDPLPKTAFGKGSAPSPLLFWGTQCPHRTLDDDDSCNDDES